MYTHGSLLCVGWSQLFFVYKHGGQCSMPVPLYIQIHLNLQTSNRHSDIAQSNHTIMLD